jgi:two-component sensor histidine kinase
VRTSSNTEKTASVAQSPSNTDASHIAKLDDAERLMALERTGLMDTPPDPRFDRLTRLTARTLGVPVVLVSLVDNERQFFKSAVGLAEPWDTCRQTPLSHSFCQYVVTRDMPLVIPDARANPLVADNLAIPDLGVAAYLGIPLRGRDGSVLGSLCAIDTSPRDWSDADIADLSDFAHLVEEQIFAQSRIHQLVISGEQRQLVSGELTHRIKNVFSVVLSLIRFAARNRSNLPDFVEDITARIEALARAHDYVVVSSTPSEQQSPTLAALLEVLLSAFNSDGERVIIDSPPTAIGEKAATAVALIVHELATNAVKYGALSVAGGRVQLTCCEDQADLKIVWRESSGPAVDGPPSQTGFGSKMTKISATGQLRGTIVYDWARAGLGVEIRVPLEQLPL